MVVPHLDLTPDGRRSWEKEDLLRIGGVRKVNDGKSTAKSVGPIHPNERVFVPHFIRIAPKVGDVAVVQVLIGKTTDEFDIDLGAKRTGNRHEHRE